MTAKMNQKELDEKARELREQLKHCMDYFQ